MNPALENRQGIFGRLGTFWHRNLSEQSRREARECSHARDWSGSIEYMNAMAAYASGESEAGLAYQYHRFVERDVNYVGPDIQQRIQVMARGTVEGTNSGTPGAIFAVSVRPEYYDLGLSDHVTLQGDSAGAPAILLENGLSIFVPAIYGMSGAPPLIPPEALFKTFVMKIPTELHPVALTTVGRELLVGIDFVQGDGCLIFRENPLHLFPYNGFVVRYATKERRALLSYTLQADSLYTAGRAVSEYHRNNQSPAQLCRALQELAQLKPLVKGGVLSEVQRDGDTTRYVFPDEVVAVRYRHTELVEGTNYPAGRVIGEEYIRVSYDTGGRPLWYRELNWGAGLYLDGLCPVRGITLPDAMCAVTADGGSVRVALLGAPDALDRFWRHVHNSEAATGICLGAVLAPGLVNPLDFWFTYLLGAKAYVIDLRTKQLGRAIHNQVLDFIANNKPCGALPIIRNL